MCAAEICYGLHYLLCSTHDHAQQHKCVYIGRGIGHQRTKSLSRIFQPTSLKKDTCLLNQGLPVDRRVCHVVMYQALIIQPPNAETDTAF